MIILWILIAVAVWAFLFWLFLFIGDWLIDSTNKTYIKKFGKADPCYDEQKKNHHFQVITYFVGIPVLILLGIIIEIFK